MIFKLISLGFVVVIIALIVFLIHNKNKRKQQLNKIDNMNHGTK
ncbi:DUF4083 domain-containing protein [Sporosarcina sp. A2]